MYICIYIYIKCAYTNVIKYMYMYVYINIFLKLCIHKNVWVAKFAFELRQKIN